jgi:hypothetical protein
MHKIVFFIVDLLNFASQQQKNHSIVAMLYATVHVHTQHMKAKRKKLKDFPWLSKCLQNIILWWNLVWQEIQNKFPNPSHIQFLVSFILNHLGIPLLDYW